MIFNDLKPFSSTSFLTSKSPQRPYSQYFEDVQPKEKVNGSKNLKWDIEESKENVSFGKNYNLYNNTASVSSITPNNYSSGSNFYKKDTIYNPSEPRLNKNSKSTKVIKYNFEEEVLQPRATVRNGKQSGPAYGANRQLTMSLNYGTKLNDLIPIANQKKTFDKSMLDRSLGKNITLQRFESDKADDHRRNQFIKAHNYGVYSAKSSKEICDNIQLKYNKLKQENHLDKSVKLIREESRKQLKEREKDYKREDVRPKQTPAYLAQSHQKEEDKIKLKLRSQKDISHKLSIHDFQVGACKGEGAFGQVFLAIHKQSRMLVALKKVSKDKVKYMLDQFVNEMKIQMFLDHPNIVKLYGFFDDHTHFYIVMEYMEGGCLFSVIKKQKKMSEAEASSKLREICLGLKEMHDNSLLHRDIKPENIVITNNVCKLCDFGWSAVCKDRRTTYCGTLDYVSPELIEGQGYDDCVDIWCIGVLAYEMICGKTPFYNISKKETMKKIKDVNYDYPAEVTKCARMFIDRILKKNPDDRVGIDQLLKDTFLLEK